MMIVGAWQWPQYESALAKGLTEHGVKVSSFSTTPFFNRLLGKVQLTLPMPGPALIRLNQELIREAKQQNPDWILCWRSTHLLPRSLRQLHQLGIRTVSYNNDDPFGPRSRSDVPWHHHWLWGWYLRCLPHFHRNFFYRRINCEEARKMGVQHAEVLLPYFLPWQDRPVELSEAEQQRFGTDVVFVGHYEPDGRGQVVNQLVSNGVQVKVWSGASWGNALSTEYYQLNGSIKAALQDEYAKALCGAKICLAFLSKFNRDNYTRRCFEIPACGRLMLAERTPDLLKLFKEDEEACFFSSQAELLEKVSWLLQCPEIRDRIAQAGRRRVWADGHDVISRSKQLVDRLHEYKTSM